MHRAIRFQKEEGGYSLIELIATIAILALVGTGISTLMLSGTRLYGMQSASVRLQSKAQLLTAQLRSYYLTADAKADYADDTYTYNNGGTSCRIRYDAAEQTLYWGELTGETWTESLLADNVTDFTIAFPASTDGATGTKIETSYTLEDHGTTYDVQFVTALRNRTVQLPETEDDA